MGKDAGKKRQENKYTLIGGGTRVFPPNGLYYLCEAWHLLWVMEERGRLRDCRKKLPEWQSKYSPSILISRLCPNSKAKIEYKKWNKWTILVWRLNVNKTPGNRKSTFIIILTLACEWGKINYEYLKTLSLYVKPFIWFHIPYKLNFCQKKKVNCHFLRNQTSLRR